MDLIVKYFNELSTTELYEILKTRFEIFFTEQECIYQDLDDKDQDAIYVFCYNDSGRVAGCLRVFWKDHDETFGIAQIGRVVTLEHGKGIGGRILHEGVRVATEQLKAKKIYLEAQEYAIDYYAKEGFMARTTRAEINIDALCQSYGLKRSFTTEYTFTKYVPVFRSTIGLP